MSSYVIREQGWTAISCGVHGLYHLNAKQIEKGLYNWLNSQITTSVNHNKQSIQWSPGKTDLYPVTPVEAAAGVIQGVNGQYAKVVAQYIFSDNHRRKGGEALAKYITDNKLGEVISSKSAKNLNSGNFITSYIWTVDRVELTNWYIEQYNKRNNKKKKERKTGERKKSSSSSS